MNESLTRRTILRDVQVAYENVASADRRIKELEDEVAASEEAFQQARNAFQNSLAIALQRFVSDPTQARTMAAAVVCLMFGYGFLFINLDLKSVVDVDKRDIIQLLAQGMAATT